MSRAATAHLRVALGLAAAAVAAGCHGSRGGTAAGSGVAVTHAVVPVPASRAEASVFMVIENRGGAQLTLVGGTSPDAEAVQLHREIGGQMEPVQGVDIPAGGRLRLVPGSYHLMLANVGRSLAVGDTVTLHLTFEPNVSLTVRAPVLTYTDAVSDLPVH